MKISVIIPVYNAEHSIVRCLDSVSSQTLMADYQILVINDGSTDDSKLLVEKYIDEHPGLNIILIDKPNGGVSSARNMGLKMAQGDYIALLDSDDAWLSTKMELQVGIMESNPQIEYLGCNLVGQYMHVFGVRIKKLSKIKYKTLFIKWYPQTSTVLFKRNILNTVGLYDEYMTHGEDGHYLLRICVKHSCWFMPNQLVEFGLNRKRGFGESGLSANLKKMHQGQQIILKYARTNKLLNNFLFVVFYLFEHIKYFRRKMVVALRNKR